MSAPRNRKHVFIRKPPSAEAYSPHPRKITQRAYPGPTDRKLHADVLTSALAEAREQARTDRDAVGFSVDGAQPGLYIEFQSPPGFDLKLESLGHRGKGIEVVNVRSAEFKDGVAQLATVFVPDGRLKHFFDRFQEYAEKKTTKGKPRHKDLVDRIADIKKATFRAMWTDSEEVYPDDGETIWWEVWLRRHDGRELGRLREFAEKSGLDIGERHLGFDDRIVILVKATSGQLSASLDVLNDLAEVRGAKLVRRYGFGVPNLNRALRSANDALTLVAQAVIRPFSGGAMREMHLHELPWPKDILETLGETEVRLRVTLSYFVEPNPSRRGWKKRHRYASHGLRFELKTPTETVSEFRKRLNKMALDEEEEKPNVGGATRWFLGSNAHNKGSVHSDMWSGTAAELAGTGVIGIYPVSGWWKDQPKRDRSEFGVHYGLVVSIDVEAENIDIWTPVAQEVGIPVEEVIVDV